MALSPGDASRRNVEALQQHIVNLGPDSRVIIIGLLSDFLTAGRNMHRIHPPLGILTTDDHNRVSIKIKHTVHVSLAIEPDTPPLLREWLEKA